MYEAILLVSELWIMHALEQSPENGWKGRADECLSSQSALCASIFVADLLDGREDRRRTDRPARQV